MQNLEVNKIHFFQVIVVSNC